MLSVRGEPLFVADWDSALMIHYEVDGEALQEAVPFELDYREGRAFVTLVAFTLRRMRPWFGGRVSELLFKPISTHEFLNVRTYVRHDGETGIFFLAEWLSNKLSVLLGPRFFGLPYRLGFIRYDHRYERDQLMGAVEDAVGPGRLEYRACHRQFDLLRTHEKPLETVSTARAEAGTQLKLGVNESFQPQGMQSFVSCEAGSIEEWLMERYTAFTCPSPRPSPIRWEREGRRRFFRVWHQPWPQVPVEVEIKDQSLLEENWNFFKEARLIGGNFSPGLRGVWMGRPHKIQGAGNLEP